MPVKIRKAERRNAFLRLALIGVSGSGKTLSGLKIASGICEGLGVPHRIAVLDTENGSSEKYAEQGIDFDVLEIDDYSPESYCEAITQAVQSQYTVLIIDSLSHAWAGKGGILEGVDQTSRRMKNQFAAWGEHTPRHNKLIESILCSKIHIIGTMRSKMAWVTDESSGKAKPIRAGMAPIQREGMEYEFDVVGELDAHNFMCIIKSRLSEINQKVLEKPGPDFGRQLSQWLVTGKPALEKDPTAPAVIPKLAPVQGDAFRLIEAKGRLSSAARTLGAAECLWAVGSAKGKSVAQLEADADLLERRVLVKVAIEDLLSTASAQMLEAVVQIAPTYGSEHVSAEVLDDLHHRLVDLAMARDNQAKDDGAPLPEDKPSDDNTEPQTEKETQDQAQADLESIREQMRALSGDERAQWITSDLKITGRDSRKSAARKVEQARLRLAQEIAKYPLQSAPLE